MRWLALVLFSFIHYTGLSAAEKEGNLHALLVCDTLAHKLKQAYLVDLVRMKHTVEGIAVQSNLQLNLTLVTGEDVTAKRIQDWISKLPQSSNDTVLVYYVGRQARNPSSKGKWPSIMPAAKKCSISAEGVLKSIRKCKPRLTLIFFDCYDSLVKVSKNRYAIDEQTIPTDEDYTNIRPLFTVAKGSFLACSGPKGKRGVGIIQGKVIGGAFTTALIESIAYNLSDPSWSIGSLDLKSFYDGFFRTIGLKRKPLIQHHVIDPRYQHILKNVPLTSTAKYR